MNPDSRRNGQASLRSPKYQPRLPARRGPRPQGAGRNPHALLPLLAALAMPVGAQTALSPSTLPAGGAVAAGQAGIATTGAQMTVTQGSDKAILNWQRFDIGSQAAVRFVQPSASSVALNRVLAGEASQIQGQLSANGQVYLVNPAGIVFGPGSRVDVGGLVASVMDIADADFLAGRNVFRRNGATGSIVNQGEITAAEGGLVALLAPTVRNEGVIRAQLGNVALAAGERITLDVGANGHLQLAIAPATLQTLVENRQLIVADGGQVLMTSGAADALSSGVVANSGTVQARTLQEKEGRILLLADMAHGEVRHGGLLDASAPAGGNGGFVETSAAKVTLQQGRRVTTAATQGKTGTWLIDPNDYTIAASGGNITGAQLSADLASSNVSIATASQGTAGGNGDIFVNDAVGWSANTLTLNAERHIEINAVMTASGTAGLALNYGGTNGNSAATPVADSRLMVGFAPGEATGFAGRVDFPGRSGTGFLSINGQGYHVLGAGDLGVAGDAGTTTLQGMANNIAGHYALGADIDAAATAGWNGGQGFQPVGTFGAEFTATFDGLGHVISNLHIARGSGFGIGLFGVTLDATLRNVGLAQSVVSGLVDVGTLAGAMHTSGPAGGTRAHNVFASGSTVQGSANVGGLLGEMDTVSLGGTLDIRNAYSTGTVTALNTVGGLIGELNIGAATLADVYSTSTVTGGSDTGGLVGNMSIQVASTVDLRNAHATGNVIGGSGAGGLFGLLFLENGSRADLSQLYATGNVTAPNGLAGGLVGFVVLDNAARLILGDAYASGDVQAGNEGAGGLLGGAFVNSGSALKLHHAHATGNVTGSLEATGGLVGGVYIDGDGSTVGIDHVYATGRVTGDEAVGGLIGKALLSDESSFGLQIAYAAGNVNASGDGAGGLVGRIDLSSATTGSLDVSDAYAVGAVAGASQVGGLVGHVLGTPTGGSYALYNTYAAGAVTGTGTTGGLVGVMDPGTSVTTSFWDTQRTGQASSAAGTGMATADMRALANFTGATTANGNANPGWDISTQGGDGSVWHLYEGLAAPVLRDFQVRVEGVVNDVAKTYDGLAHAGGGGVTYTVGGLPAASVRYTGGSQGATHVGSYVLGASLVPIDPATATPLDYQQLPDATFQPGNLTITPAALSVAASDAGKVYGQTYGFSPSAFVATGLQNGETIGSVALTSAGTAGTAAVGGHAIAASSAAGGTFDAGNYSITYLDGTLTITPAPLSVTAHDAGKVFGETLALGGSAFTASGLQNGETIGNVLLTSSGSAATAAVGHYAITASGATGGSFRAGNYRITYVDGVLVVLPVAEHTIDPPAGGGEGAGPGLPTGGSPGPATAPPPRLHVAEDMERAVSRDDTGPSATRGGAVSAAMAVPPLAVGASGVPFLTLAPEVVRLPD